MHKNMRDVASLRRSSRESGEQQRERACERELEKRTKTLAQKKKKQSTQKNLKKHTEKNTKSGQNTQLQCAARYAYAAQRRQQQCRSSGSD